jgi:lipoprotein-anchoring transpeptidase ErfK/SrfK
MTAVFRRLAKTALTNSGGRATRLVIAVAVVAAATLAAVLGLFSSSGGGPTNSRAASVPEPTASARPAAHTARPVQPVQPGITTVATLRENAPRYTSPGGGRDGTIPASWYDRPSVLPVIGSVPGWVKVRLAQRPDGSVGWVPASYVTLSNTPFRIVINLATTHLELFDDGQLALSAPAGVGTTDDPTPTGEFFVAFDEQPPQPNPGYGPFIMVTSAHSEAISDWEGSGDAVIGIHGPLGDDSEIGTTGARVSHGCIRLHDAALVRLSEVPPGTPIDIIG